LFIFGVAGIWCNQHYWRDSCLGDRSWSISSDLL